MRLTPLALAGAIALSAAGAGVAQPGPPPGPGPGPADHGWRRPDPAQMAEQHAERLRALLQLRSDQEPALKAFIAAMQPSPEQMQRRETERGEVRELTTPQRLDRMQAEMAGRQSEFARRADAIKRFYAQLSPAQQKAFDALPMGHHGLREHMREMHGGPGFGPDRPPGMG
jgi:hypothetical protein